MTNIKKRKKGKKGKKKFLKKLCLRIWEIFSEFLAKYMVLDEGANWKR